MRLSPCHWIFNTRFLALDPTIGRLFIAALCAGRLRPMHLTRVRGEGAFPDAANIKRFKGSSNWHRCRIEGLLLRKDGSNGPCSHPSRV